MDVREQDYVSASSFADLRDLVAHRAVELQRGDHVPLDEKEIWWALEATLRILAETHKPSVML